VSWRSLRLGAIGEYPRAEEKRSTNIKIRENKGERERERGREDERLSSEGDG
jgi:hypothetical protein